MTVSGAVVRPQLQDLSADGRALVGQIVRRGYRVLAHEVHPDHGGDAAGMRALVEAHEALARLVEEHGG